MSALFFQNQDTDEQHTNQHVLCLVNDILYKVHSMDAASLYAEILKKYPNENMNRQAFKRLLFENLPHNNVYVWLKNDQTSKNYHNEVMEDIKKLCAYDLHTLEKEFASEINEENFVFDDLIKITVTVQIKAGKFLIEKAVNICAEIINNKDKLSEQIEKALEKIDVENENIHCANVLNNQIVCQYLSFYGVQTFTDFRKKAPSLILLLIWADYKNVISILERLSEPIDTIYVNTLQSYILTTLDDRSFSVLNSRYGLDGSAPKTLEECGERFSITRERIRQIENKAIKKIDKNLPLISENIRLFCDLHFANRLIKVISVKELTEEIHNGNVIRLTAFLLNNKNNTNYKYSNKGDCFYDSNTITEEEIINSSLSKYSLYITEETYNNASIVDKSIIDLYYRRVKSKKTVFIKKGSRDSDITKSILNEFFPEGYQIANKKNYEIFREQYLKIFGDSVPSERALYGTIERDEDYCQINRGCYLNRDMCSHLTNSIENEIFDYIIDNLPNVEYQTIYDKFRNDLEKLGINNYYYMKGLIDPILPEDLQTARNYITMKDQRISAVETRINYMKSFDSVFSMDEIKSKFPGIKEYTFLFIIYDEMKKGLLELSNKHYIYYEKTGISDNSMIELKEYISELFSREKTSILTSRKIFAKLRIEKQELLAKFSFIEDQHALFSLMQFKFKNDLYFSRPYISIEDSHDLSTLGFLNQYLSEKTNISLSDITDVCLKMNIPMNRSFNSFAEEFSNEYVQDNEHTLLRKDILDIKEDELKQIKSTLELIIDEFDVINTKSFQGYALFPKISRPWNQFLLIGIIRSYFLETYQINLNYNGKQLVSYTIERNKND